MVADRRGLTDLADIPATGTRTSVWFGLAVLTPVLIWVYATARQTLESVSVSAGFVQETVRMLSLVLALALPVSLPWFANSRSWADTLLGPLLVVLIPLPLVTVLWLATDLNLLTLLMPIAAIAVIMVAMSAVLRLLALIAGGFTAVTIVQTALSLATAGLVWALRENWLEWLLS
jgi:hypothetical protein